LGASENTPKVNKDRQATHLFDGIESSTHGRFNGGINGFSTYRYGREGAGNVKNGLLFAPSDVNKRVSIYISHFLPK
jgi:hypothetical protein